MAINRRLQTDQDFQEALDKQVRIRVFQNDHMIDPGGILVRFDGQIIALQSSVSDLTYHQREQCEFFEIKKR
jgi:ribosome maturation factor RimP